MMSIRLGRRYSVGLSAATFCAALALSEPAAAAPASGADCARTLNDYAFARDHPEGGTYGDVFTDDAVISFAGRTYSGAKEILAELNGLAAAPNKVLTRHVLSNIRIDRQSNRYAKGTAYLTLFAAPAGAAPPPVSGPAAVGVYQVEFRLDGQRCRIQKSALEITFVRAAPAQASENRRP